LKNDGVSKIQKLLKEIKISFYKKISATVSIGYPILAFLKDARNSDEE
jgi:hypothetical protein